MPLALTTPVEVKIDSTTPAGTLKVRKIQIDDEGQKIDVWAGYDDGQVVHPLDGHFTIEDLTEERVYVVAGKTFTVPAGNHFTDLVSAAPVDVSSFYSVVKEGAYKALIDVIGLAGTVS